MAKVTPVIICTIKQIANNEPKFHKKLILLGWEASTTYELQSLSKECDFKTLKFIF
jgi:hypothetical protein